MNQLSQNDFRLKIANLQDNFKSMNKYEHNAMEEEVTRFVSILPELFSDDLDRKTLWERIGNGLISSLSKSGGDLDQFVNYILDYIKANHGKVASNEKLSFFISTSQSRPIEWKEQLLKTIEKKSFLIIVKARAKWNEQKTLKKGETIDTKKRRNYKCVI